MLQPLFQPILRPLLSGLFDAGYASLLSRIKALFANGEVGAWYDPSDLTTMFTDSAGTTGVVTPGTVADQPVGLILDKSKGLVLGVNAIGDPSFDSPAYWSVTNAGWGVGSGVATATALPDAQSLYRSGVVVIGKTYLVSFEIKTITSGTIYPSIGGTNPTLGFTTVGIKTCVITASTNTNANLVSGGVTNCTIDNFSVRELPGAHATQSTAASRPLLSARVNLLTATETFSDAVWTVSVFGGDGTASKTPNYSLAPDGTTTACRIQASKTGSGYALFRQTASVAASLPPIATSTWIKSNTGASQTIVFGNSSAAFGVVSVTAEWTRISGAVTAATAGGAAYFDVGVGTGSDNAIDVSIWHPQLETGSTASRYQRVTTVRDYDSTGFPYYLKFDGTDDSLATASIDFTATDKMSVVAGVRKLSDAAAGLLVELGPYVANTNGSFVILAPISGSTYDFYSRGTVGADNTISGFAAPTTNVVSGIASISAPSNTIRVDGVIKAQVTTTQGTGNYGNHALYIGRRGGTTLPFNGHIYSLIVRGAQSTDAQITSAERYVAGKTGVTL